MRVRLMQKGFENLTGYFGVVEFKDGVSVHDVSALEIERLAAAVQIADEKGNPVGAAHRLSIGLDRPAPVTERLKTAEEAGLPPEKPVKPEAPAKSDPMPEFHTAEQLAAIADQGIKALREVGDLWGVKGRSIPDLVKAILQAQGEFKRSRGLGGKPEADAPDPEPVETVEADAPAPEQTETVEPTAEQVEAVVDAVVDEAAAAVIDELGLDVKEG